ncbi:MAG: recombinase family protein [Synergistes jonesii]|uniref:recombinase family protein n=1 Tax=Synergistes jonesii TaxID=2754 RepID=UPI002A76260F|nr:recombinase family protein [Synergistes jonesii]MDY2985620.1 recombinase family protein [Synergistes jonesii]
MADGKVSFAYRRFLGLDKDKETGKIVVNPEQAETVRSIFRLLIEGMTPHSIATELTRRGIKTPAGKDVWNQQTVRRMLSNEKYKGDALLQKEFTVNFLEKKMKKNEGEVPQYYVEGNHEAIISPAVFDMVQAELAKRTKGGSRYSGVSIFSSKIKCADCGGWYGSKVWHSTDRYRKVIYRCNRKYNGDKCQTPHVTEDKVKAAFVSAYNQLATEKKKSSPTLRLSVKRSVSPMSCRKKRASWRKGGACGNDANNSDGECPYSAGSGRVPKTLRWAAQAVQRSQGSVRWGDGRHIRKGSKERTAGELHQGAESPKRNYQRF